MVILPRLHISPAENKIKASDIHRPPTRRREMVATSSLNSLDGTLGRSSSSLLHYILDDTETEGDDSEENVNSGTSSSLSTSRAPSLIFERRTRTLPKLEFSCNDGSENGKIERSVSANLDLIPDILLVEDITDVDFDDEEDGQLSARLWSCTNLLTLSPLPPIPHSLEQSKALHDYSLSDTFGLDSEGSKERLVSLSALLKKSFYRLSSSLSRSGATANDTPPITDRSSCSASSL